MPLALLRIHFQQQRIRHLWIDGAIKDPRYVHPGINQSLEVYVLFGKKGMVKKKKKTKKKKKFKKKKKKKKNRTPTGRVV